MGMCHTFFSVSYGFGNVFKNVDGRRTLGGSEIWEGDNPPGAPVINCGLFACPAPPQPHPNFHP